MAFSARHRAARRRPDRPQRPAARHRLLRRHHRHPEVPAADRRKRRCARRSTRCRAKSRPALRRRRRPTKSSCACRRRPASSRGPVSSRARGRSPRPCATPTSASSRSISTEIVGPVIGNDLQRKGIYATLARILGITLYIAFRFRLSSRSAPSRDAARHGRHARVPDVLRLRALAERHRGDPDDHRLLGQRHHRDLRPRPRELPHACAAAAREPGEHRA